MLTVSSRDYLKVKILDNSTSSWCKRYCIVCHVQTTALSVKIGAQDGFKVVPFFEVVSRSLCTLVRGSRPGKNVQLTEAEVRGLCLKTREIFLSQPILLELEAPLKICGEFNVFISN